MWLKEQLWFSSNLAVSEYAVVMAGAGPASKVISYQATVVTDYHGRQRIPMFPAKVVRGIKSLGLEGKWIHGSIGKPNTIGQATKFLDSSADGFSFLDIGP